MERFKKEKLKRETEDELEKGNVNYEGDCERGKERNAQMKKSERVKLVERLPNFTCIERGSTLTPLLSPLLPQTEMSNTTPLSLLPVL